MKLKTSILFVVLVAAAPAAFGQKPVAKPVVPNKPAAVTKLEVKPSAAKLPSVTEILAKYVQAIGGRAAVEKIKNRTSKGTVELSPVGIKGTFESVTAAPDKAWTMTSLTGIGDIIEGYDGKVSWSVNPISGNHDKQGEELEQAKLAYNFYRDINLDKLYSKMELKGVEKVGANDAYVVTATAGSLPAETFYFDTKSGLMVKQDSIVSSPEGKTPITSYLEDFRVVDGVMIPFKLRTVSPQFEVAITFNEIKNNTVINDAKFSKPQE